MGVILDGRSLDIEAAMRVAEGHENVQIEEASLKRMEKFRSLLERKLARGEVVYGVNTGIGSLSDQAIPPVSVRQHQVNLIRSHSAGVGEPMPEEVVRTAMLLRLNSLARGNSALRPSVAELLLGLLNSDVTPCVPSFGSLGASGDLVPSAHVALTMIGEGKAFHDGNLLRSSKALASVGLKPVRLEAKEGLSLINGTSFTTAFAAVAISRGAALLDAANAAVALKMEALSASEQAFDERLMNLKEGTGQREVARQVRLALKGSRRLRKRPVPQDPYSIRCVPQVHGAVMDALDFARKITVGEMNSVSDNPVFFEDGAVLHGGNFHAQPVAMALDLLAYSLSYLGVMSLARVDLLLTRSPGTRRYMAKEPGLESGLMILEYTASALAAENAKQAYPVSTYPANVSGGVENHASYGVNAGLKAMAVAQNLSRMLAIEMICASNFVGRDMGGLSRRTKEIHSRVRRVSPLLEGDRSTADEIEALSREILSGELVHPPAAE